jgi:hypothetical protein
MKLSLQDLTNLFPDPLWLPCERTTVYADLGNPQRYSNETARYNASLNVCSLSAFMDWIQQNLELDTPPTLWPSEAGLPEIWEVVNGTALLLNGNRVVLLPSEAMDTEEFVVPQEWVDIPPWSADYYLPMQVNLEDNWICVWGYVMHPQLKTHARYDPIYRMYSIDRDWVIPDLDLFWQAQNIGIKEQVFSEPVDPLSRSQHERLIQSLSQPSPYSPRLDLDFEQWATLLERTDLRQKLYQHRLENATRSIQSHLINTGLWLKDKIDEVAKELSWVLLPAFTLDLGVMRAPTPDLTSIISQLKPIGVDIPEMARGAYQDLQLEDHLIRCYAIAWSFTNSDNIPQWYLLLVLAPQTGVTLPPGLSMAVRDDTQVLVERSLDGKAQNQSLFAGVSGGWEETFQATISLMNGVSRTMPPFGFNPESS